MEERQVNSYKIWTIWEKGKLNSNKTWKIQKKIVKRQGKYRRKQRNDFKNMNER